MKCSWLAAEFGVTTPGQALEAFADLEEGPFIQQVRVRRPKREARLSPAAVGELTRVYRQYVPSLRAGAAETARLEGRLAELVNAAYGLTPEEIASAVAYSAAADAGKRNVSELTAAEIKLIEESTKYRYGEV